MEKYQSYKPSGVEWVGEIPEKWRISKFKYVSKLYTGNSLNDEQKVLYESDDEYHIPYVSSKDIDLNTRSVNYNNGLRIPKENNPLKVSPKDSFLLCVEGGSSGRKMVYLDREVCFVNKLCSFKSVENTRFQYYFIQSSNFQDKFRLSLSGLIGGVSISTLRDFELVLPSIQEQYQIVQFLDENTELIDKLISTKERKISLLKEQRTSLIHQGVTKGLNSKVKMKDSGVEWIGEIPEHWGIKKLKHLCDIVYGISPPDTTYNDEGIGEVLINGPVEYSETDFGITRSLKWTTEPKKFTKKGSLLFCLRGSTTGRMNITHQDVSIGRGVCSTNSRENQWFMIYSMFIIRIYIQKLISGSTFPSVVKDDVDNYQICNPSLEEQNQIVDFLDSKTKEIDDLVRLEQNKIGLLKEYRQSLISEVVTGKFKVTQ
jgi:type I restriction enzyme S subunit